MTTRRALSRAGAATLALVVGLGVYRTQSPMAVADLLRVQLGGGFQALPLPPETEQDVYWDAAAIAGYVAFVWVAAPLAHFCLQGGRAHVLRRSIRRLVVAAAAADLVEDALLLVSLRADRPEADVRAALGLVTIAAVVKFVCFIPAVVIGAGLVVGTCVQALRVEVVH